MYINEENFKSLVSFSAHEQLVQTVMDKISAEYEKGNPVPLLKFFNSYTQFNGCFANGVAALTSLIGRQRNLFVDKTVKLKTAADRSNYVASFIFDAARDEYHDRDAALRTPHRSLAQAFMQRLVDLHPQIENYNELFELDSTQKLCLFDVGQGYVGGDYFMTNDVRAFFGIGYHIGSEILADSEFTIIHRELHKPNLKHLHDALGKVSVIIEGAEIDPYAWIKIHSGDGNAVEQDHFAMALTTAKKALQFTEEINHPLYVQALKDGFLQFAKDHETFFSSI